MSKKETVNQDTVIIDVDFALSVDEILEITERLGAADSRLDTFEQQKKAEASQWSAKIEDLKTECKRYVRILRDKKETRSVECFMEMDFHQGEVSFVSVETELEVYRRAMLPEERQMNLSDFNSGDQLKGEV